MGLLESCPAVIRPAPVPSSRCDMTKLCVGACEGREWTYATACLFSQPCDKSVRQLLFSWWWIITWFLMSLLTRFCFVSGSWLIVNWRKWAETLQTHFSVSCAECGKSCLLILVMYIYLFKTGCKITTFSPNLCRFIELFLLRSDILLFLPRKSIFYVTMEYEVTHNYWQIAFILSFFKGHASKQ